MRIALPRPAASAAALDALLTRRGVVAYWLAAALSFALARVVSAPTLSYDEARAVETAQEFAAGYSVRQPPLFDQLSWLVAQLVGPGVASQLALRFVLIALIGILTFVAVERATGRERYAAAASLSLSFHYVFGWSFHHWGTHTLVLCAAALASFVALLDLAERPGPLRATLLGLALGVGLMSKFSFLLFLGGLLAAALSLPELRGVLRSRWMLLAALVAAALCAPYLVWLATVKGDVVGAVRSHMIPGAQSHAVRAATGLFRLAWSLVGFMLLWLAVLAILMPRALDPRTARDRTPTTGERLAFRTTVAAVLLAATGIAATGATTVAERYMHPLLVLAPVLVFGRAAAIDSTAPRLARIAGVALAATLALLLYRLCLPLAEDLMGKPLATGHLPYAALARELEARGYDRGTVLMPDVREAGNLRGALPELRAVAYGNSHRALRPPHRAGSRERCFLIWRASGGSPGEDAGPLLLPREAFEPLAREPNLIETASGVGLGRHRVRWAVLDLAPASAACR